MRTIVLTEAAHLIKIEAQQLLNYISDCAQSTLEFNSTYANTFLEELGKQINTIKENI